jgi:hypothetical protein
VIGTDCTSSCKSNNHTITTTTAPCFDILNILLVVTVNKLHIVFCQLSYIDYVKIWLHIKCSTYRHPILREIIVFNVKMSLFFGSIMARTSYMSIRWWFCPNSSGSTHSSFFGNPIESRRKFAILKWTAWITHMKLSFIMPTLSIHKIQISTMTLKI